MKSNKKLIALSSLFLCTFAFNSFPSNAIAPAHADGDWQIIDTKILAVNSVYLYVGNDGYLLFSLNPHDYSTMSESYVHAQTLTNFSLSDYNILTHIQLSNDNENYIPFNDIYKTGADFFFKNGTFRWSLKTDGTRETLEEEATYEYIKILEGCEFPSYDYCLNGGTKKKYVQQNTTISKLSNVTDQGTSGLGTYQEFVAKRTMTYTGIASGWNNSNNSGNPNYRELILSFGEHGVDYLANSHTADATNRATSSYDIGNKLSINGLPIYKINEKFPNTHVGYDHGFAYFYIYYPVDVLSMNNNNMVPTIHIEEGAEFIDVLLPEVTLKFSGGGWIATTADEFKVNNPIGLDSYLQQELPYEFDDGSHAILDKLPEEGCKISFNINTGDIDLTQYAKVIHLDGLYDALVQIIPSSGTINLYDKKGDIALVQTFSGFPFVPNTDYGFEFEIICGENTTFKLAINHLLIINYTFSDDRTGVSSLWILDQTASLSFDYYKELETYKGTMSYDGSSSYDFIEGDSVYNFANVVKAFDLYSDAKVANIEYIYENGAVTDGKYNAGTWILTIKVSIEGYEPFVRIVTINVHGTTSVAKIYYDDGEPIEVPIGAKLVPPANPDTYREGEYDYVFDGWYYQGAKWDFENDIVQGDMHLYSRFIATTPHYIVTVRFEGLDINDTTYSLTKGSTLPFFLFELEGATFEVFYNDTKITSLVVENDITIVVRYTVIFTYTEAKEATCTEDGNVGYWSSPIYPGYYFADAKGREVIPNAIISKLNHNIVHLDYMDSSCHEVGHVECYYCQNCHKHYTDPDGEHELEDWAIAKKPHELTHHDAVAATCENDGYVEHWTCANEPGTYYGDSDCTIVLDTITIPAIGHDYKAPTYTWKEVDDGYECTASIVCAYCHDEISETKVAEQVIVRQATCSKEGQISYFVRFDDARFNSQNKIVNTAKTPHNYVHVDKVEATKDSIGVKEHYECSECHKTFIKDGENFNEIEYADLLYAYKSSGCGGSIATASLVICATAGALSVLIMMRRKKESNYEK